MPLLFYLFAFLNFFMTIPRPWTPVQDQRSPFQTSTIAKPAATDARFKAGAFLALIALLLIIYNLHHSISHYRPRRPSILPRFFHFSPGKFLLCILLLTIRVAYALASAFSFDISPLNASVSAGYLYGLGYAPTMLIIIILNIWGFVEPNEDKALLAQRRAREQSVDEELGIARHSKPSWWRGGGGGAILSAEARLKALTEEMPGPEPPERPIEMTEASRPHRQEVRSMLDV